MGPMSNYLEVKLNSARVWLHDEHPIVCEWAQNIVQGFETEIQSVRLREEEEQILMGNR